MSNIKITVLLLLCTLTGVTFKKEKPAARPNILFIMADDLGYGELGCYGQQMIQTPVLDSMAAAGIRLTDFYAGNTVCAPSRSTLLTGLPAGSAVHRGNRGYQNNQWVRVALPEGTPTLGSVLKKAGYATGYFGKWHLDDDGDPQKGLPGDYGFDVAYSDNTLSKPDEKTACESHAALISSPFFNKDYCQMYPAWYYVKGIRQLTGYNVNGKEHRVYDRLLVDRSKEFIRNQKKPWFTFVSFKISHAPEILLGDTNYAHKGWPETERIHAARISLMDKLVGELIEELKAQNKLQNTLIFFTSDNGADHSTGHDYRFFTSNGPLRGRKRDMYEGGIRVPGIIYWPGTVKPAISSHVAAFHDVMPTLARVAGAPVSGYSGLSFYPLITEAPQPSHPYLYWEFQLDGSWQKLTAGGFRQAVRKGDFKAVRYGIQNPIELYDLKKDPAETLDLASQYPEMVKEMEELMKKSSRPSPYFPYGGVL